MATSESNNQAYEADREPAARERAPEVSIVIPCYNRKDMVTTAVGSALAQTMKSIEVIVVDDGSTDGAASSLEAIGDARVRVIRLAQNSGGAHARNVGIEAATGKYVALLDSDDWWHPTKLASQLDLTRDTDAQGNWVIYNRIERRGKFSSMYHPQRPFDHTRDDLARYLLVEKNYMQTSGLLAPTQFFKKVWFDAACKRHQDVDILLRMRDAGARFIYCDKETVVYLDHDGGDRVGQLKSVDPTLDWMRSHARYLSGEVKAEMLVYYVGEQLLRQRKPIGAFYVFQGVLTYPPIIKSLFVKCWSALARSKSAREREASQ
ncbi:glycosyltransferase family 2 protein [Rhizobium sp. TH2]|uniref:glycosyltransferase family 2 protein n=1 Tax=Rhizobium sp. TH2 TaxID=2775403 RepID=UPI002158074E|nr:glycosyltransferase family 2 protein [Rhizobium sp. TH2]UVC11660.1 glycosyltransferase family 2 protein [Rhizobium sp. TH2]